MHSYACRYHDHIIVSYNACIIVCLILQIPEAIQDVVEGGGANTQRGFGIMAILSLGVAAIMLS